MKQLYSLLMSLDCNVISVTLLLSRFTDKLTIVILQGVSSTVSLSAEGKGTTIVSHPPLQPRVDLGPHFSHGPCQKQFTLTNRGRRVQALSWTTEGFSVAKLKKAEIERTMRDSRDIRLKVSVCLCLHVYVCMHSVQIFDYCLCVRTAFAETS